MSRIEEIDKIVDEIGDADSLYEFAEGVYEDRQRIAELEEQLKNAIVPKFKIGQEVWCVYEYWWNGKFADESNKFAINNFIIDATNIDKYGQHYIFHKEYEGRDNIICYQPNFNGNRFNVMSGVQNNYIDDYYLFATKEEAEAKLRELQGEKK